LEKGDVLMFFTAFAPLGFKSNTPGPIFSH